MVGAAVGNVPGRFRGRLGNLKSRISNLRSETSNLPSEISNLPSEISNLPSEISNLPSEISNLPSEISNLPSEISNLPSEISNLPFEMAFAVPPLALPHGSGILSECVANVWLCCGVCTHARSRVGKMAVLGGDLTRVNKGPLGVPFVLPAWRRDDSREPAQAGLPRRGGVSAIQRCLHCPGDPSERSL